MNQTNHTGRVIIAGAGPGDPELITLKLQQRLAIADVILVDRLVNPLIIERHAAANALVLMTGKQGYHDGSVAQEDINKLIVGHARNGKIVLRLKGGDVAFFSNVLDELIALKAADIPFEIIPGITAASGASAFTGIPLTARGYAKTVQFITFNPCSHYEDEKWQHLSAIDDTLVFYMASKNLGSLTYVLMKNGFAEQVPMAVIEQATTAQQKVYVSTLGKAVEEFNGIEFKSPSLIIVGNVVHLHKDFNWFDANGIGSAFKDLVLEK